MLELGQSPFFVRHEGEGLGAPLYLLNSEVAPGRQGFYFCNDCMSRDGRYLWFYCLFPPSPYRTMAVLDTVAQEIRHFPETQFKHAAPFVDPDTGELYWDSFKSIWRRGPGRNDAVSCVNSLPEEIIQNRPVHYLATHLTRSPDGKEFFIDAGIGLQYIFGTLPVNGGDFQFWARFDRCHNHAQINPVDPDLVLFAQEFHTDPLTGCVIPITDRLWMMRRGQKPRPILPEPKFLTHEFWDDAGRHVWAIDCGRAVWKVDIETGQKEVVWDNLKGSWHAHHHPSGRYVVADNNEDRFYRGCPSAVSFLNRDTGKRCVLVRNPTKADFAGANYHIDPHPRFCCGGRFIVFTTTIRGEVDLAVARTEDLIERTS